MKTQKYLVTIEMPDGDMIGPGWIQELIQADCDVENDGRQKVSVEEIKAEESPGKTLDEAAEEHVKNKYGLAKLLGAEIREAVNDFKAGAKWMAAQGVTCEGKVFTSAFTSYVKTPGIEELLKDVFPEDTEVIVQIRKK